jgi:hypothetical protein
MDRWLMLTACSFPLVVGCAPAVTPGLANAPRLGGSSADERSDDVVANGTDACGRDAEHGVLRGQWPACPTVERAPALTAFKVKSRPSGGGLVVPWLQHFYVRWPCEGDGLAGQTGEPRTVAWTPSVSSLACLH